MLFCFFLPWYHLRSRWAGRIPLSTISSIILFYLYPHQYHERSPKHKTQAPREDVSPRPSSPAQPSCRGCVRGRNETHLSHSHTLRHRGIGTEISRLPTGELVIPSRPSHDSRQREGKEEGIRTMQPESDKIQIHFEAKHGWRHLGRASKCESMFKCSRKRAIHSVMLPPQLSSPPEEKTLSQ